MLLIKLSPLAPTQRSVPCSVMLGLELCTLHLSFVIWLLPIRDTRERLETGIGRKSGCVSPSSVPQRWPFVPRQHGWLRSPASFNPPSTSLPESPQQSQGSAPPPTSVHRDPPSREVLPLQASAAQLGVRFPLHPEGSTRVLLRSEFSPTGLFSELLASCSPRPCFSLLSERHRHDLLLLFRSPTPI